MAKKTARKSSRKRSTSRRELVHTGTDKRYVKRTARGRFKESDDVSRSLSSDRRRSAKKSTRSGYGDQGDSRARSAKKR